MDKETANAIATDAFLQAQEGLAVELDPDVAEAMGAFVEDAVTPGDLDASNSDSGESNGQD